MSLMNFSEELKYYDIILKVEQIEEKLHEPMDKKPKTDDQVTPDIKILAQRSFYFSKIILCNKSDDFVAAINFHKASAAMTELNIKIPYDLDVFNTMLNYLWGNSPLTPTYTKLIELFQLADMFVLTDIKNVVISLATRRNYSYAAMIYTSYILKDSNEYFKKLLEELLTQLTSNICKMPTFAIEYALSRTSIHNHIFCLVRLINRNSMNIKYNTNILARLDEYGLEKFITSIKEPKYLIELAKIVKLINPPNIEMYHILIFNKLATFSTYEYRDDNNDDD